MQALHSAKLAAVVVATAISLFFAGAADARVGENMISNASFEEIGAGGRLPQYWYLERGTGSNVDLSVDRPRTGEHHLRMSGRPDERTFVRHSDLIAVEPGESYRLQMYYRIDEVDGSPKGRLELTAIYHDAERRPISYKEMRYGGVTTPWNPKVSNTWKLAQAEIQPQSGAAYVSLGLDTNPYFEGTVSVDDISLVKIVRARLDLPDGARAYDFVEKSGSGTPGFTEVPFDQAFDEERGHGMLFLRSIPHASVQVDYPTTLQGSGVSKTTFRVTDLPDGDYVATLFMGGYWRKMVDLENHQVDVNGVRRIDENLSRNELMDEIYFAKVDATLVTSDSIERRGQAIHDEYIAPRHRSHTLDVTVSDGILDVTVVQGYLQAIVISPVEQRSAHRAAIERFESQLADEFVSRWASYVAPEDFGLPIVEGDYGPTAEDRERGYVVFRRHWMDFVEFVSRPDPEDVGTDISIFATPGEYEPATFSVWPLADLEDVRVTPTELRTDEGDVIPAEAVRTWYLQQKPLRQSYPATSFSFIGTFLPDWGEARDLFTDVTQRVWLNVRVPEDARPGLYRGRVLLEPANAEATAIELSVEVLPFALSRPERMHVMRRSGNLLVMPYDSTYPLPAGEDPTHNREFYRQAAYRDLAEHGFSPEIQPHSRDFFDPATGTMKWSGEAGAGSADDQLNQLVDAFGDRTSVWVDASDVNAWIRAAFGVSELPSRWTVDDVGEWLERIDEKLSGLGFHEIYLHATSEESAYQKRSHPGAWLEFLDYVRENRGRWPHIRTIHTANTNAGQEQALSHADVVGLGMFHGVSAPSATEQVEQAEATGHRYLLYGNRGRMVPGFYGWKAGSSGTFHEFYTNLQGALNDDWDNPMEMDGIAGKVMNEAPSWNNVLYSPSGRMIGSWFWEEMREGVDDDAYVHTLEQCLADAASDPRRQVAVAREQAEQTLDAIWDAIELDVDGTLADPSDGENGGNYSRGSLFLHRPLSGRELDSLRRRAADATAAIVSAVQGGTNEHARRSGNPCLALIDSVREAVAKAR